MDTSTLQKAMSAITRHSMGRIAELMGAAPKFEIRGGYKHRDQYLYYDDTSAEGEWQQEIYLRAASLMEQEHAKTVYDVGCGSAYKLVHFLGKYDTTGFDVPETLEFLRHTYPDRKWVFAPFSDRSRPPADVVICADVIEHVPDPDELMNFIVSLSRKWLIISTPDRGRLYRSFSGYQFGPPGNLHHIREWSFDEFRRYVGRFVKVEEHSIPNDHQATQMVVARLI